MSLYRLARVTLEIDGHAELFREELVDLFSTMACEWKKGEALRSCVREIFVPDGPQDDA